MAVQVAVLLLLARCFLTHPGWALGATVDRSFYACVVSDRHDSAKSQVKLTVPLFFCRCYSCTD